MANARRTLHLRHGGQLERVDIELTDLPTAAEDENCVRVSDALDRLAEIDERRAGVVKLHLSKGLELNEIAAVLGTLEKTMQRDWTFAKAWRSCELQSEQQIRGSKMSF